MAAIVVIGSALLAVLVLSSPGPRRRFVGHCVYTEQGVAGLRAFRRLVGGPPIECAQTFEESATTWAQWVDPFPPGEPAGNMDWPAWVRADPHRQFVLAESLIPTDLSGRPGTWLALGSRGAYAHYAVELAQDLVRVGLGRAIIRLAPEANGTWETYSLPTDPAGLARWRAFWARTVEAMRSVHGAHFAFEWDVNALIRPIALSSFYPGDDVVDIVGIDAYDPVSIRGGFATLAGGTDGLDDVARFAARHGKPIAVPEWGAVSSRTALGLRYVRGVATVLNHARTAYESYFFAHQYESALTSSATLKALYAREFASG